MAETIDLPSLEQRYVDSCKSYGIRPNTSILSSFFKAKAKQSQKEPCSLELPLENISNCDFQPLLDVCMSLETSEIETVDVHYGTSCVLDGECALSLMRSIDKKLGVVTLKDHSFGKDFMRDISQKGLTCEVLTLRSSHIQKLNLMGQFIQLKTLDLDFSSSLTSFQEECFSCMPNLTRLSMCETRISNLWTTVAALSKLPSLFELRFQYWHCCSDAKPSFASFSGKSEHKNAFSKLHIPYFCASSFDMRELTNGSFDTEERVGNLFSLDDVIEHALESLTKDSSDDSEVDQTSHWQEYGLSDVFPGWNRQVGLLSELLCQVCFDTMEDQHGQDDDFITHIGNDALKYISCHSSPICFEKYYREYMIASLPHLEVLDNLPIRKTDRESAAMTFSQHFEHLPYKWRHKESVVSILQKREIKENRINVQNPKSKTCHSGRSQHLYSRSLSAAKVGSSTWPLLHPLSLSCSGSGIQHVGFRPRQFEYHPSDSSQMVFGTLDGEVVVVNHENGHIVSYIPSLGAMNSVLGLCWLKKYPSKLIAGADNGSLKLFDIQKNGSASSVTFDKFDQLTSVHVNSTDELFLASGYSRDVALYDISSGQKLQVFTDMHREHINVVKFSNHSPSVFATSSFDQDVKMWDLREKPINPCFTASSYSGNVMVCFSPDDHYILASAVDNEVRQYLAVDGRLHLNYEIAPTGSSQNYTRSYYLNGRDYIISGSCDEHVVRICCAQTGRRLRDISLEGRGLGSSMFVQSLRGDPFRDFNMSVLAAYMRPGSNSEIVKVNLLASRFHVKEYSSQRHSCPDHRMGA